MRIAWVVAVAAAATARAVVVNVDSADDFRAALRPGGPDTIVVEADLSLEGEPLVVEPGRQVTVEGGSHVIEQW